MGRLKREAKAPPKPEYTPPAWVQVSGDVDGDARFILTLSNRAYRLRELKRLEHFHGRWHRAAVERKVVEMWDRREVVKAQLKVVAGWDEVVFIFDQFKEKHG